MARAATALVLGSSMPNSAALGAGRAMTFTSFTMAENNLGSLVVLEGGKLVGVIPERRYAREIVLRGRTSPGTLVDQGNLRASRRCAACGGADRRLKTEAEQSGYRLPIDGRFCAKSSYAKPPAVGSIDGLPLRPEVYSSCREWVPEFVRGPTSGGAVSSMATKS